MSESNKILDVTYGTFSCRLEGFNDSVETMKTVVGYFHDLHGVALFTEDSHEMPDPEALARLAGAGNNGEVVVEQDENGISLRVMTDEVPVVATTDAPVADLADRDTQMDDAIAEEDVADADEDDADGRDYDVTPDVLEDVAAADEDEAPFEDPAPTAADVFRAVPNALSARIAALTAAQRAEDAPAQDEQSQNQETQADDTDVSDTVEVAGAQAEVEDVAEDTDADIDDVRMDGTAGEPEDVTPQHEIDDLRALDGDLDAMSMSDNVFDKATSELVEPTPFMDSTDEVEDADDTAPSEGHEENESVADKLQRIRAVSDRDVTVDEVADDEFAEDIPEDTNTVAPKPSNPLAQRLAEMAKRHSQMLDADGSAADQSELTKPAPLMLDETSRTDQDLDVDTVKEGAPKPRATKPLLLTPEGAVDLADAENHMASGESAADAAAEVPQKLDRSPRPELLILTERSDPADVPAVAEEDLGEAPEEDDFDLQEEVAKIEQELASRPGNEVARHGLPRSVEDAMSRIMDRTDIQLDMEETRDGRDAYAQLKAAVAVTEAAKQLGDNGGKSRDVSELFRDDLGALEQGEGKSRGRGAPLRLVPDSGEAGKSTLREVAPLNEAANRLRDIAEQSMARAENERERTFVDFVKEHSPADLAEELEAAAAYLNFVDDERDLSRPQLIRLVQTVHDDEVTREDGLRSFGRLLRQGRVLKLPNGRFRVADSTRFHPSGGRAVNG